jgi:hypothetical protein
MADDKRCPRCGTEGCPMLVTDSRGNSLVDIACSLRMIAEIPRGPHVCICLTCGPEKCRAGEHNFVPHLTVDPPWEKTPND